LRINPHTEPKIITVNLLISALGGTIRMIFPMLEWLEKRVRCRQNPLTNPRDIGGSLYQRKTWAFLVALPAFGTILMRFVWRCSVAYPSTINTVRPAL
jgi:hypothetical protein